MPTIEPFVHRSGLLQLLGELRPELLRFLAARLGDAAEAEDAIQDLWVQVAVTGPVSNGRAYLYRCAQNLCRDRARAHRRRTRREGEWLGRQQISATGGADPVDPRPGADETLIAQEEAAMVAAAIALLPEAAGRAFRLHKLDGLSHAQVAVALGISVSGVEKHMAVAMAHLRGSLSNCGRDGARRLAGTGWRERRGDPGTAGRA